MNYILTTGKNSVLTTLYFEEIEDARKELMLQVRNPIKQYIEELNAIPELRIRKIGKKKKVYEHYLPYDLIQGADYVALVDKEADVVLYSGVIVEASKLKQVMSSVAVDLKLHSDDEDED